MIDQVMKKEYKHPKTRVVKINSYSILASSGNNNHDEMPGMENSYVDGINAVVY